MSRTPNAGAVKALQLELKKLNEEPVEGFVVNPKEDDFFKWEVGIFGPPSTLYEGGYFKAEIKFPADYPYSPPSVTFHTKMWHPNIYEDGNVCISILHPPVDDPQSGELPSERWNPTQNVRTILLSIISLLNEPNTFSPANVDASVMFRRWKASKGSDKKYEDIIREQVKKSKHDAIKDGVTVPTTLAEYCVNAKPRSTTCPDDDDEFFMDDAYDYDDDDDDDDSYDDEDDADAQDSGTA